MSEQTDTADGIDTDEESEATGAEVSAGPQGLDHYAGPMFRDVMRVTVIVGGFGAVLLAVHNGIEFYADPTSEFSDIFEPVFAVFK